MVPLYEARRPRKWTPRLREESLRAVLLGLALAMVAPARGLPAQVVRGQVLDQSTSVPVSGVVVTLLDSAGAVFGQQTTEADGRFSLSAPGAGRYRLRFQVPGYSLLVSPLLGLTAGEELTYPLTLRPIPPTLLDTLLVEGQPIPWNLVGFYQRKHGSLGAFATREEWQRWAVIEVRDVVRHISPFALVPNAGRGPGLFGNCRAAVFLDHLPLDADMDLNTLFLDQMAAIEVYRWPYVPPEFDHPFGVCAAIALWSRVGLWGQAPRLALGIQAGAAVAGASGRRDRVGVHAVIGFEGPVELYPAVSVIGDLLGGGSSAPRAGWELLFAVRVRPLGWGTGWYLGLGERLASFRATATESATDEHDAVLLSGWELKLGGARPFVELQVLDPFRPRSAVLNGFVGVSARIR